MCDSASEGGPRLTGQQFVLVRCVRCKTERKIYPGEIGSDDYPMCEDCYTPMVVVKAVVQ